MMRFSCIAAVILQIFTNIESLNPEDVGLYHTKAFDLLGEMYSGKRPRSLLDLMVDVGSILSSFCEDEFFEDADCVLRSHEIAYERYEYIQNGSPKFNYPDNFDAELKKQIELIQSTVNRIDHGNVEEIVEQLTSIHNELMSMENVDEIYKDITVGSSSIAIESTKLWHETFINTEHPLHNMVVKSEDYHRNLQYQVIIDIGALIDAIQADISGAISGTIESIFRNPGLIFVPTLIPLFTLFHGTVASTAEPLRNRTISD